MGESLPRARSSRFISGSSLSAWVSQYQSSSPSLYVSLSLSLDICICVSLALTLPLYMHLYVQRRLTRRLTVLSACACFRLRLFYLFSLRELLMFSFPRHGDSRRINHAPESVLHPRRRFGLYTAKTISYYSGRKPRERGQRRGREEEEDRRNARSLCKRERESESDA